MWGWGGWQLVAGVTLEAGPECSPNHEQLHRPLTSDEVTVSKTPPESFLRKDKNKNMMQITEMTKLCSLPANRCDSGFFPNYGFGLGPPPSRLKKKKLSYPFMKLSWLSDSIQL